jgi:hypothetical protein
VQQIFVEARWRRAKGEDVVPIIERRYALIVEHDPGRPPTIVQGKREVVGPKTGKQVSSGRVRAVVDARNPCWVEISRRIEAEFDVTRAFSFRTRFKMRSRIGDETMSPNDKPWLSDPII